MFGATGGPESLIWQEDLPLRNMVRGMGEPRGEEGLNVHMSWGRICGRASEGAEVLERRVPVCQSPSVKCPCLLSHLKASFLSLSMGISLEVHLPGS